MLAQSAIKVYRNLRGPSTPRIPRRVPLVDRQLSVVITGGTKGLGKELAREFVRHGDNVFVCSRDAARVAKTVVELQTYANVLSNDAKVEGRVADVTHGLGSVADDALTAFGCVDAWINNAGTTGSGQSLLAAQELRDIMSVVDTNLLGTIYATREALRIMRPYKTGHVFNVLGSGAEGEPTPAFAVYGATKKAIEQFSKSVSFEEEHVQVHRVSPGAVDPSLLYPGLSPSMTAKLRAMFAKDPQTVARDLVPKMRKLAASPPAKAPWGFGKHIRTDCL